MQAQFLGYASPQTVQATLGTNVPCTGSAQTFTTGAIANFDNLGQTQHYAYVKGTNITNFGMQMFGVDAAGNQFLISDTATVSAPLIGPFPLLAASGYFPNIQVVVTCFPAVTGTFTLNYSGTSATSNQIIGGYQVMQQDKTVSVGASAGTNFNEIIQGPSANSFGQMVFKYGAAGPSGSSVQVNCLTAANVTNSSFVFALATTTGVQVFDVPPSSCPIAFVQYNAGGASAATYSFDYLFIQPGNVLTNAYTHITGTTATVVKSGPGTVHSVVVGTSAAGTISLFDLVPGSCTGTPATNVVSVITEFASATPPPPVYIFDTLFLNGICVKASAGMDITVSSQ